MKYFTADWHLFETRPHLFHRWEMTTEELQRTLKSQVLQIVNSDPDAEFYHLGDVNYNNDDFYFIQELKALNPNSKWHLIFGNHDEKYRDILTATFDTVQDELWIDLDGKYVYINHYPINCKDKEFSLTGHIHSLWKVQPNMINVGVDAWHFKFVSEEQIIFTRKAVEEHYDENVFPYCYIKNKLL